MRNNPFCAHHRPVGSLRRVINDDLCYPCVLSWLLASLEGFDEYGSATCEVTLAALILWHGRKAHQPPTKILSLGQSSTIYCILSPHTHAIGSSHLRSILHPHLPLPQHRFQQWNSRFAATTRQEAFAGRFLRRRPLSPLVRWCPQPYGGSQKPHGLMANSIYLGTSFALPALRRLALPMPASIIESVLSVRQGFPIPTTLCKPS